MLAPLADTQRPHLEVEQVYRDHFEFVWTNLRRFGVPRELLEDACHDVFVVVQRRALDFDPGRASPRTWVFAIVRRVASDHRRSRQRRERKLSRVRAHSVEPSRHSGETVAEARTLALEFLGSIDEEHAAIFVLSQLYGVPLREIAASLDLNPNTVASRLRATRTRFKTLAGGEEEVQRLTAEETPPEEAKARVLASLCPLLMPVPKAAVLTGLKAALLGLCVAGGIVAVLVAQAPAPAGLSPDEVFASNELGPTGLRALDSTIPDVQPLPPSPETPQSRLAPRQRKRSPVAPAPVAAAPPVTTSSPTGDLRAELVLITKARAAVRQGKPTLALRTAHAYASRFPQGLLQTEMDVVRVDSLCRLGRREDASAVAGKLGSSEEQSPKSVCPEAHR